MNKKWLFAIVAAIAISCGNETKVSNETVDSLPDSVAISDTIQVHDTISVIAIAATLGGDTITPADRSQIFYAFTVKLAENKRKPMSSKEARKRFMPMDPKCDQDAAYTLKAFFEIDSMKRIGETPDPDMGQIVSAEIRLVDTIRKSPNGSWVVWTLTYSTAEQCPYAHGTYFMLSTYDKSGKTISTQCMGCDAGGADAPISWTKRHETNIFKDGSFRGLFADSTEDYDANDKPVYSIYRKTYTGQIDTTGRIVLDEKEIERSE
jgi:hypothetical protein